MKNIFNRNLLIIYIYIYTRPELTGSGGRGQDGADSELQVPGVRRAGTGPVRLLRGRSRRLRGRTESRAEREEEVPGSARAGEGSVDRLTEPEQVLHQEPGGQGSVRRRTQEVRVERRESAAGEHHDVPNPKGPKVRTGSLRPAAAPTRFIAAPLRAHTHGRVHPLRSSLLSEFWF